MIAIRLILMLNSSYSFLPTVLLILVLISSCNSFDTRVELWLQFAWYWCWIAHTVFAYSSVDSGVEFFTRFCLLSCWHWFLILDTVLPTILLILVLHPSYGSVCNPVGIGVEFSHSSARNPAGIGVASFIRFCLQSCWYWCWILHTVLSTIMLILVLHSSYGSVCNPVGIGVEFSHRSAYNHVNIGVEFFIQFCTHSCWYWCCILHTVLHAILLVLVLTFFTRRGKQIGIHSDSKCPVYWV